MFVTRKVALSFLLFVITLFAGVRAIASEQEAIELREMIKEVVSSNAIKDHEERAQSVRKILAKHPQVLQWAASGKDLNSIVQEADLPAIPEVAQEVLEFTHVTAIALNDRLAQANRNLENLQKIKSRSSAKEVSIASYQIFLNNIINSDMTLSPATHLKRVEKRAIVDYMVANGVKNLSDLITHIKEEDRLQLLQTIPTKSIVAITDKADQAIGDTHFSNFDEIKIMSDKNAGFDMSALSEKMAKLAEVMVTRYFDEMSLDDKRQLVVSMLELPPHASAIKKLSAILNSSGPTVQKMFQLVGNEVKSPQMKAMMDELKSNIKPFPTEEATKIIEASYGKKVGEIFKSFGPKPLASASVGQVYLATDLHDNELIVKVMRPGIHEKAQREIALFRKLATDKGVLHIIDQLEESLFEELDFRLEAKNLQAGQIYVKPEKGFDSVHLISDLPPTANVMVMSKAPGKPISKVGSSEVAAKNRALASFLATWVENALFNNGFFHGDLHGGNIFFQKDDSTPNKLQNYHLTTIDFGNATTLEKSEQQSLLKLILGSATNSTKLMVEAFNTLKPLSPEEKKNFTQEVDKILEQKLSISENLNLVVNKALALGMVIPKNFILFNRARAFLEQQIRETTKALNEIDPEKRYERFDITSLYVNVLLPKLGKEALYSLFGLNSKEEFPKVENSTINTIFQNFIAPKAGKLAFESGIDACKGVLHLLEGNMKLLVLFGLISAVGGGLL
ncbi:MAG: AarF/ABC1/UbiB kinase family protein [Oligoflexia bacterium]|nr:AarF/ABC1/UbiB kinase family protein [Oligoflexia bacterium]MBF0365247.1 AarF/ABC1/UbiB kinase family protein [Oligoflexia bacterium]